MDSIALFFKQHLGALAAAAAGLNLFSAALLGIDKQRAKRKLRRISEAALLWSAVPFSALGALAGMLAFRHKTRHAKFVLMIPLLAALQLGALFLLALPFLRGL